LAEKPLVEREGSRGYQRQFDLEFEPAPRRRQVGPKARDKSSPPVPGNSVQRIRTSLTGSKP
jgi:hypothetical protein